MFARFLFRYKVTIPYLAVTLHISIQASQNLVKHYVENKNKTKSHEMTVTYVLRGFLKNCKRKGIFIVEDSNIEVKRDLFEKVDDELIFSIQKSKNSDFSIISLVDKIDSTKGNGPLQGSIVGNNCLKRDKLKEPPGPPVLKISSSEKYMDICSKSEPDRTAVVTNKTVAPFVQKDTLQNKSTNRENKHKKEKSGISTFFKTVSTKNASDNKSLVQKVEDTSKTEDKLEGVESEGDEIENSTSSMEVHEKADEIEANQQIFADTSKVIEKKNNKRGRDENMYKNTKRRRRIVERNDSESDDMFEKIADEDTISKSDDEPERVSSPVRKNSLESKNRKRKAIDKTYQDSEGFIVTKTEYIYETASEEEENEITVEDNGVKQEIKSLDKKKNSTENIISHRKSVKEKKEKKNNKLNQPTLMNFFKKK